MQCYLYYTLNIPFSSSFLYRTLYINIKIIENIIENLNDLSFLQNNEFTQEDNEFIKTLNIIAIKPMLYICNVDEESVQNGNEMSKKVSDYLQ